MREDWDFPKANTQYMSHGLHPYPARMIPQIAKRLISRYSSPRNTVLDPFCGSGTVLVESRLAAGGGRNSFGVDINPLACLLAKVKSNPINPIILKNFWKDAETKLIKRTKEAYKKLGLKNTPEFSDVNISYWFKPSVIIELAAIKQFLDSSIKGKRIKNYKHLHDFFSVCFSATVRGVSKTRPREFKLYRLPPQKLKKYRPSALPTFIKRVEDSIERMEKFYNKSYKNVFSISLEDDARELHGLEKRLDDNRIDLIVTSPPYGDSPTTVAYGQFTRYPLLWLGYDKKKVYELDKLGLGGQKKPEVALNSNTLDNTLRKIAKKDEERAEITRSFFTDMYKCLDQMYRILKEGNCRKKGYCCIVMGNRTVSKIRVPTDRITVELGKNLGFKHILTIQREIQNKTIPLRNVFTKTMTQENVIILRK